MKGIAMAVITAGMMITMAIRPVDGAELPFLIFFGITLFTIGMDK